MLRTRAADNLAIVCYVNLVGGQDELVFDGGSLIVDEQGEVLAERRDVRGGPAWSPTSTSTRSSARGCTTRGGARRRALEPASRCRASMRRWPTSRRRRDARRALPRARGEPPLRDRSAEVYDGARAGHARLRAQERLRARWCSASRAAIDSALVARASPSTRSGRENVVGVSMPSRYSSAGHARATPRRWPRRSASASTTIPIDDVFERLPAHAGPAVRRARAADITEENLQARIRGNTADGALQQVRLAGAHHRQQERDGRRLLHALRRHGRRLRGDQGRAQDAGLRARALPQHARRRGR